MSDGATFCAGTSPARRGRNEARPALYLKNAPLCPDTLLRDRQVIAYRDPAGAVEYHRFQSGNRPILGCRRVRVPCAGGSELWPCTWLASAAWALSLATHRYVATGSEEGHFRDWMHLNAPDDRSALRYAQHQGLKVDLGHIERRTRLGWQSCALDPLSTDVTLITKPLLGDIWQRVVLGREECVLIAGVFDAVAYAIRVRWNGLSWRESRGLAQRLDLSLFNGLPQGFVLRERPARAVCRS